MTRPWIAALVLLIVVTTTNNIQANQRTLDSLIAIALREQPGHQVIRIQG